ncbi:MAG: stage II sporulation protein D [Clostridia bacterium]|nr:stage II sporulation protein D [Clostridia bacterium]
MKKLTLTAVIYVIFITLVIPPAAVYFTSGFRGRKSEPFNTVKVYIKNEDRVAEMDTSQYLKEVVGAEMPASFSYEALKAQAVAARTYLCSKISKGGDAPEHKGAPVCTDHNHCKAWLSESDRRDKWEEDKRDEYWKKISKAVEETAGEILTFEGKPISALFHSTSSGKTENAGDVWSEDVPYLRSVESRGDELSPKFYSELVCTEYEFKSKVSENVDKTDWNSGLYGNIVRSEAGGIKKITLGGVEVKGTTFRQIFGLRSTNVTIEQNGEQIIMKVKGNGHGVGMSQYGADFMASNGSTYDEILKYYYTGVNLEKAN